MNRRILVGGSGGGTVVDVPSTEQATPFRDSVDLEVLSGGVDHVGRYLQAIVDEMRRQGFDGTAEQGYFWVAMQAAQGAPIHPGQELLDKLIQRFPGGGISVCVPAAATAALAAYKHNKEVQEAK